MKNNILKAQFVLTILAGSIKVLNAIL